MQTYGQTYNKKLEPQNSGPNFLFHYPQKVNFLLRTNRAENFELQNRYEGDELFDKLEEFTQKYETLLENPVANDFLQAEAGLVKMMQEINISLVEGLNFQ